MENIKKLESMMEKLESIKDDYCSLKIDGYKIDESANFVADKVEEIKYEILMAKKHLDNDYLMTFLSKKLLLKNLKAQNYMDVFNFSDEQLIEIYLDKLGDNYQVTAIHNDCIVISKYD